MRDFWSSFKYFVVNVAGSIKAFCYNSYTSFIDSEKYLELLTFFLKPYQQTEKIRCPV